jgi:hypothetical protein
MTRGPLQLFLSYARQDHDMAADLRAHLAPLRHEGIVSDWYDRDLVAGADWDSEIRNRLDTADLVIALVSAEFLSSPYAYDVELAHALDLHHRDRLRLIPVIVRNCRWQDLPVARLNVLPAAGRPVTSWDNRDDAWVSVVTGIEAAAREVVKSRGDVVADWLASRLLRRRVIRYVQQRLLGEGLYPGPVDGEPGRDTERGLVAYQRREGLVVDARIGPEVLQRLLDTQDDGAKGHPRPTSQRTATGHMNDDGRLSSMRTMHPRRSPAAEEGKPHRSSC